MMRTATPPAGPSRRKRLLLGLVGLVAATAIWLPTVHLFYRGQGRGILQDRQLSDRAGQLLERHLAVWTAPENDGGEILQMRRANAEWDFMGRCFVVWSLANAALREPAVKDRALAAMDRIIEDTLRAEREGGMYYFLMPYARGRPFVVQPGRSLFIDGEIALMLAARRIVSEKAEYRPMLRRRIDIMLERMARSPVLSAESYPDECWTFCNTIVLAAILAGDFLDGTDHSQFVRRWVATAKQKLTDPATGLLVSAYTVSGRHLEGPEGSSIWMAVHCLGVIDQAFAADQYRRAKQQLSGRVLGFGYAREWPRSWLGGMDVDSGPLLPGLGASLSSSGLALVAASTFADEQFYSALTASLDFAGFPHERSGQLRYCMSNQVGDAAVLYSTVAGPLWEKINKAPRR